MKTLQEIEDALTSLDQMWEGIPKARRMNYIGRLNCIALVLEDAKREALKIPATEEQAH